MSVPVKLGMFTMRESSDSDMALRLHQKGVPLGELFSFMNYRSIVAFGTARKVVDPEHKVKCLRVISEHLIAGRWADVRGPSEKELKATTVLEFSIEEASSKVRSGPPLDDQSDYGLPVWAGVLPLEIKSRPPIPDDKLVEGITLPDYVRRYDARLAGHTETRNFPIPD